MSILFILITTLLTHAAPLIVDFEDGTPLHVITSKLQTSCRWIHPTSQDEALVYVEDKQTTAEIHRLSKIEGVEAVEYSIPYSALSQPNDPLYSKQWNFKQIGLETAWSYSTGRGVKIAVLDTGYRPVTDMASDTILQGTSFVPDEPDTTDFNGHGTHIIGTLAQYTNNGLGVAGIAYDSSIIPIKVLNRYGSGQSEWIATGIDELSIVARSSTYHWAEKLCINKHCH